MPSIILQGEWDQNISLFHLECTFYEDQKKGTRGKYEIEELSFLFSRALTKYMYSENWWRAFLLLKLKHVTAAMFAIYIEQTEKHTPVSCLGNAIESALAVMLAVKEDFQMYT